MSTIKGELKIGDVVNVWSIKDGWQQGIITGFKFKSCMYTYTNYEYIECLVNGEICKYSESNIDRPYDPRQ